MSEFDPKTAASIDQQLEMLVAEVESKFIDAEDALSELRHSIRRLKSYRPSLQESSAEPAARAPAGPSYELPREWALEPTAAAGDEGSTMEGAAPGRPKLNDETVGQPFWSGHSKAEPEPEKHDLDDYGTDSTSEGSWPMARTAEPRGEPMREPASAGASDVAASEAAPAEPQQAGDEDDESRREEVARLVAQMREGGVEEDKNPDDDEAKRRDVAEMVAELRGGVDVEAEPTENGSAPSGEDDQARREEVARMVAELRAGGVESSEPEVPEAAESDDESTREDVASMVARMRAELDSGAIAAQDEEGEGAASDEDVRDEVRRAVEAARAEMASGYKVPDGESEEAADKQFSFTDWQSTHVEPLGPPVIVIKDSEGRVELARVYETLSRVNCDENAALLNYTPHSVTVGLNARAAVPEVDAMTEAVKEVFGRACEVDSDGVRVNVKIGRDLKGKASAA